ncbi:MAG: MutS family DNA mismatch repair protein [Clostridium sp.]|nr:MutS family DNA mismatch repair protein [Clostridium sp.]
MTQYRVFLVSNFLTVVIYFIGIILIAYSLYASYTYMFGFIPLIIVAILLYFITKKLNFYIMHKDFVRNFGKKELRKRDFKSIRQLFDYMSKEDCEKFYVDDQTWNDLTMDEIYTILDRTITSPGEQMLYKMLRTPLFNEEDLIQRNKIINNLQSNRSNRDYIGMCLLRLNRLKQNYVCDFLWNDIEYNSKLRFICIILAIMPIASIASSILLRNIVLFFVFFALIIINVIVHFKIKKKIYAYVSCMGYVDDLISAAGRISKLKSETFRDYTNELAKLHKTTEAISKRSRGLGRTEGEDATGVMDILNILFLIEENKFFSSIDLIKKHKEDLKNIYTIIGEIDSMLSIAAFKEGEEEFVNPEFVSNGGRCIEIKDMVHPLIKGAVANSINIDNSGIILTGSNMSGKSTFLRTIGVNVILAQTFYICKAKYYKANLFKIMTSISPEDNIMGGKSYYFSEAESLLRIIKEDSSKVPLLCIIDEIFRGTNPIERVNASVEILDYLQKHNAIAVVATHDLEITDILKDNYKLFYFTEDVNKEGMAFDYKIKEGVCRTRNAIKLLKYLNYPEEIVENTNKRIEKMNF